MAARKARRSRFAFGPKLGDGQLMAYRDYEYVDDRWNNDWDDDAPSDEAMATH